jgi:outer membrane protein assembly factor BamB
VNQGSICRSRLIVFSTVVVGIVSLTTVTPPVFGQASPVPWPMVQHDSARSGRSPYNTAASNGKVSWKFAAGLDCQAPAIAADGTIYASCFDVFIALRPDGTLKWRYTIDPNDPTSGSDIMSAPAIGTDGTIYFVSSYYHPERPAPGPREIGTQSDYFLSALSPNGKLKWNLDLSANLMSGDPIVAKDGTIYLCGAFFRYIYAADSAGKLKWKFRSNRAVVSAPAIGLDGTVYVACDDGILAISPNGTQKWKFPIRATRNAPAVGADGTIYVSSSDNNFYALDPDGALKWKFATGGWLMSSPAIGADGSIYVISDDHNLYVLNPDGTLKAKVATGKYFDRTSAPVISADGVIYVSGIKGDGYNGRFYLDALSPDGILKWKFSFGGYSISPAAIGADGTVYAGSTDGQIYAFGFVKNHH